ncbi:hypothetical protein ACFW1A_15415 [Kitasatospora sp. NPDC058965]|uniref:hypothetical protein n=1 Tax=Kitasatospora sp. NPDC058965 TaxID=3346682 RepID=UPI0036B35610
MSTDQDFEDGFADLARALRGAAELAPELNGPALTVGAQRYGRRRRRRRRAVVASGLAVLVLAGAGGVVAAGRGGALRLGDPAARVSPMPVPMTGQELLSLVTGLLPPGKVSLLGGGASGEGTSAGAAHTTGGTVMFDDGAGASVVEFSAEWTGLAPGAAAVCMDGFTMPQDSCDRTVQADGSVLVIDKLRSEHTSGGREWRATWAGADGRRVQVIEFNGQPAATDRADPPLGPQQLTALVTAAAWERVFASLVPVKKAPAPSAPATTAGPGKARLLSGLTALLPAGSTSSVPAGSDQAVLAVTLDGRSSMVLADVQPASDRGRQDAQEARTGRTTPLEVRESLPDGTLVVTNSFGNGKTATNPVLHWTVDVYRPDGFRVSLSEWNGENAYTARPGTPALSPDQLKTIALDPAWRS